MLVPKPFAALSLWKTNGFGEPGKIFVTIPKTRERKIAGAGENFRCLRGPTKVLRTYTFICCVCTRGLTSKLGTCGVYAQGTG